MQSLADLVSINNSLKKDVIKRINELMTIGAPSINSRAKKLLKQLK
ncbi:MAG TPA: hypothetical protein VI790_02535 [Candidatus Nanoarchaeia archaeon]|nr:hypothetical protein [Candidatus Nanoarchaeia archaeon]